MSARFAGYAAVFDRPDGGGDIIRTGAFLDSLKRAGEVPLLWQHKAGRVLGRIEHLSEDKRGLRVIARLDGGAEGRRVGALLQGGKLDERLSHPFPMSRAARRWMWNLARRFRPSWVRCGRTVSSPPRPLPRRARRA